MDNYTRIKNKIGLELVKTQHLLERSQNSNDPNQHNQLQAKQDILNELYNLTREIDASAEFLDTVEIKPATQENWQHSQATSIRADNIGNAYSSEKSSSLN